MKSLQARNVNVGDSILNTTGMREVVAKEVRRWPSSGTAYHVELWVSDVCGPPWKARLDFAPSDRVTTRRAASEVKP